MADTTGTRSSQIKSIDRHGDASKIQMSDGTGTSGHLATFDANGNVTDGGAVPSGTGTIVRETPSGTLNGTNTSFSITYAPSTTASLTLYLNGVEQIPTTNYSISSSTITYVVAPKSSDLHIAQYTH